MALIDWPHTSHILSPTPRGEAFIGDSENTASFIGIVVAISGNVLISLALNCQKLAHKRLEGERRVNAHTRKHPLGDCTQNSSHGTERRTAGRNADIDARKNDDYEDDDERTRVGESSQNQSPDSDAESNYGEAILFPSSRSATGTPNPPPTHRSRSFRERANELLIETEPLLIVTSHAGTPNASLRGGYGTGVQAPSRGVSSEREASGRGKAARTKSAPHLLTRLLSSGAKGKKKADDANMGVIGIPVDFRVNERDDIAESEENKGNESDYLKSKLWWLGLFLMAVGESGNFISYGFAPASIVAPLGTFALIANCFFAPLMLKERFRKRDLLGIMLAIFGAVTVVLSASSSNRRLTPDALIRAITQRAFIVLAALYIAGATAFVSLSSHRIGYRHVWIDVGACALFGGFTVLSTKAFSSMLTKEWAAVFKEWITYPILAVLIGTAVGQIKYLNRALMKFDSKVVIPAQFVFFNISAIVGSAVLYGDFRQASLHQVVTFLYGCAATFAGVFMLTWGSAEREESTQGDEEDRGGWTGRAQLVLPVSPPRPAPLVRAKTSSLTLSPAQRALLVRTLTDEAEDDS